MTLTKQIQNLTVTDTVQLKHIIPVTTKADQERAETLALLKRCLSWVGQDLGESISKHVAEMEGKRFSAVEYHYENAPDSQKV